VRGLLWRRSCGLLVPVQDPDGQRAYGCGSGCGHADVPAEPVERDLLLKVLVRAAFAFKRPALVSAEELHRWQGVNPLDSHAMLVTGFVRVDIDQRGHWHPAWRHEAGHAPKRTTGARAGGDKANAAPNREPPPGRL